MSEQSPKFFIPDKGSFDAYKANKRIYSGDDGWRFECGDPETFRFADKLLKPGGDALDVGSGDGRASTHLLFCGMNVTALDSNAWALDRYAFVTQSLQALNPDAGYLTAELHDYDYLRELPDCSFDTIISSHSFNHYAKKDVDFGYKALACISQMTRLLKVGGYLWLRLLGAHDEAALDAMFKSAYGAVGSEYCACSGIPALEPVMFLNYFSVRRVLVDGGMSIEYQQTVPHFSGGYNIEGGSTTDDPSRPLPQRGYISILAQKM